MNNALKNFAKVYWHKNITSSFKFTPSLIVQRVHQCKNNLLEKKCSLSYQLSREVHRSSINQDENKIQRILSLSENKLQQFNIINSNDLIQTLGEIEKFSTFVTENDLQNFLYLINAALEKEHIPNTIVVEKFWKLAISMQEINFTDRFLSNFLILCRKSSFSVSYQDILNILDNNKIPLSQNLGELLMANLCCQASGTEVEEMLLTMKSLNLNINTENIFCSLISFKGITKDLNGLSEILYAMKSAEIDPSPLTQSAFIIAYNKCGSFAEAKKILCDVAESDLKFNWDQYKDIVLSTIECGILEEDSSHLSFLINSKLDLAGDFSLKELCIQLLHNNYAKEVIFLLSLEKANLIHSHLNNNVSIFINEWTVAKYNDPATVIDFCDKLVRNNLNTNAFEVALEISLQQKYVDLSWKLLKEVKNRRDLKDHFFWPLFAMKSDNIDIVEKTLQIMSRMAELKVDIGIDTLQVYIIPNLPIETPQLALQMLCKHGVSKTKAVTPLLASLLWQKKISEAIDIAKDCGVSYLMNQLLINPLAMVYQYDSTLAVETFLKLLMHSKESEEMKNSICHRFIFRVCKASKGILKKDEVATYVKSVGKDAFQLTSAKPYNNDRSRFSRNNEKLRQNYFKDIHSESSIANTEGLSDFESILPEVAVKSVSNVDKFLTSVSLEPRSFEEIENGKKSFANKKFPFTSQDEKKQGRTFIHPNDMSVEELEGHLIELKAKKMNTRGVLRKLLLSHSRNRNEERVEEIKKALNDLEKESSPGMLSTFFYNNVLEKNDEAAVDIFYTLNTQFPKFIVDSYKVVDLCSLLVLVGKTQEALNVMRDYVKDVPRMFHNKKSIQRNCHQLLSECSSIGGYSLAREMCSLLLTAGLINPSSIVFGPLIKSKLESNDLVGAVEEVEEIYTTYKVLPMRVEILMNLLESTDAKVNVNDLVDRMCDLISKDKGRYQARQDLLSASLQCRNQEEEEARKIFKYVEENLEKEKIRHLCDYFVSLEKVEPLRKLLAISKESSAIDRMYVCESLLNIYFVNRNSRDALNLSTLMQEEFMSPPVSFTTKLNSLLKTTAASSSQTPLM